MSQMIESFMNRSGPLRAQALELPETAAVPRDGPALLQETHPLHSVKVRVEVCLGAAEMTVGELLGARAREVLILDRAVEDPVDLVLDGKVVARGELVAVEGAFAVRITELPLPLKLT
ncbi:MAG: surface presentation of antigen protein [Ramlibacter sp.]|jgi:flagellar motor switch protein FliN/FliY|nr:surface presentation of antigen protein [Ramlibacter sp.]